MRIARVLAPLVALAALAFLVRGGALPAGTAQAGSWDPASAYRLRLVELTLASGRAPRVDRFLEPPAGAVVPWPPLFHAGGARLARWLLARPDGDPALGGVDERDLERWAARLPAAVGVLGVLIFFLVARHLGDGDARSGLAAAALFALLPVAGELGAPTRFAPDGLVVLFTAAQFVCVQGALAGRDRVDGLSFAMAGGLLAGLAALLSLESLGASLAAVLAFLYVGWGEGEQAAEARRVGIFFCVVAAVVCGFSRATAPALASGTSAPSTPEAGLSALFLVAGVPCLVLGAFSQKHLGPVWRGLAVLSALTVLATLLDVPRWIAGELARVASDAGWLDPGRVAGGWWSVAAWGSLPFVGLAAAPLVRPHLRVFLAVAVICGCLASWARGTSAPVFLATWSLAGGLAITRAPARARVVRVLVGLACVLVCALGWLTARGAESAGDDAIRAGLGWMRDGTPRAAPWNSAVASPEWSVLGPPDWDGWITYHARRPAACAKLAGAVGELELPWAAVFARDPVNLVGAMRGSRAGFVVAAPRLLTPEVIARYGPGTNLERLASGDTFPGLQRVWGGAQGGDVGDGVSVWRVAEEGER